MTPNMDGIWELQFLGLPLNPSFTFVMQCLENLATCFTCLPFFFLVAFYIYMPIEYFFKILDFFVMRKNPIIFKVVYHSAGFSCISVFFCSVCNRVYQYSWFWSPLLKGGVQLRSGLDKDSKNIRVLRPGAHLVQHPVSHSGQSVPLD